MSVVRVTKQFSFEMAHTLDGYDGACREIHGHSYRLFVTVRGVPCTDEGSPKCGMVVDRLDHSLVIRRSERNEQILGVLNDRFGRVVEVDYQPTCENMISDFAARISAELPEGVELTALRLYETATSYAEWLAEDNA